jgi:hypothetical protein
MHGTPRDFFYHLDLLCVSSSLLSPQRTAAPGSSVPSSTRHIVCDCAVPHSRFGLVVIPPGAILPSSCCRGFILHLCVRLEALAGSDSACRGLLWVLGGIRLCSFLVSTFVIHDPAIKLFHIQNWRFASFCPAPILMDSMLIDSVGSVAVMLPAEG